MIAFVGVGPGDPGDYFASGSNAKAAQVVAIADSGTERGAADRGHYSKRRGARLYLPMSATCATEEAHRAAVRNACIWMRERYRLSGLGRPFSTPAVLISWPHSVPLRKRLFRCSGSVCNPGDAGDSARPRSGKADHFAGLDGG